MKQLGHPVLTPGTKVKVLSVNNGDAWYSLRKHINGKDMLVLDNLNFAFSDKKDAAAMPESEGYDNKEGFNFYSVEYTIIPA